MIFLKERNLEMNESKVKSLFDEIVYHHLMTKDLLQELASELRGDNKKLPESGSEYENINIVKSDTEKGKSNWSKFDRQYKFAQEVSSLINMIYYEKDIEKKRELITKSLMICQKSRHNIRNREEMLGFIYDIKNTLYGYKGGFVNPDAEHYYMTKIYPFFEKHGDEDFVYCLDEITC